LTIDLQLLSKTAFLVKEYYAIIDKNHFKGYIMDLKEIASRLEIIKLSIPINDKETIAIQSKYLKDSNDIYLKEVAMLLDSKNYRQALYLIKKYIEENDIFLEENIATKEPETEKVLNVEDMLKMSPVAKETIKEFKRNSYTKDDLESFAKNISHPFEIKEEKEASKEKEPTLENEIKEELQKEKEELNKKLEATKEEVEPTSQAEEAISEASKDTPLDEMSKKLNNKKEKKRIKVFSKYKTLREKFSKDKNIPKESNSEENSSKENKNSEFVQKDIYEDNTYPPIAHIEEKFREAFSLYPPLKENERWVEDVIIFLKSIALNSYKDSDVEKFLDEYFYYKERGDIAKASQFLLLAASTEAKYAQFLLARELFKGQILKRNIKASFELMTKLANSGYADAICDLGQFYEYGVGVAENKKIALKLYEKAFELGLQRATKHINRLKESSSLLASLKKVFN